MGAQNVAKVFTSWRHLNHREARALTYMALIALDADNPPVFFGGWEAVATALGYDCEGKRANAKEQFRRALADLVSAGAVVSSGQARLGVRAEYALALDPQLTFVPADAGRSGNGRGITWSAIPREGSRDTRESTNRTTEKVPHVPHPEGAPPSTEKVPHVPHPEGGDRGTVKVAPMSTEEPLGGVLEEIHGGEKRQSPYVTREPTRTRESHALDEEISIESEKDKQSRALQALIEEFEQREAS